MKEKKELLTTGEVARLLGVTNQTVGDWFDKGALSGFRIPGRGDRKITRESVARYFAANPGMVAGMNEEVHARFAEFLPPVEEACPTSN